MFGDSSGRNIQRVNFIGSMPVGDKPDGIIVSPFQAFCVLVETFAEIIFFSGGQIHDIETDFIRFIAFPFHTFPSHVPAIGRDDRILVISHHAFGQVDSFPVLRIIGIQIGIRRFGIVDTDLFATGIN